MYVRARACVCGREDVDWELKNVVFIGPLKVRFSKHEATNVLEM